MSVKFTTPPSSKGWTAERVRGAGRKAKSGQDVWRVTHDGRQKTLVTSATSSAAIDEAVVIYGEALKRLAKR